jgi:hypothetical protein
MAFRYSLRGPSLLCLLLCAWAVVAEQTSFFKSRPDIYPPVFNIEHSEPSKLAPGYIFITPYEAQNPGPYIFDNSGV